MIETPLVLGPARHLVGTLTDPGNGGTTCAIILSAGLLQRSGPHRLHVDLARALAASGIATVRYDASGLGDSGPRPDALPLMEVAHREPREVMDDLAARFGFGRFLLMGICSGAYCAFKAAVRDPRVAGAALINPQDFVGDADWEPYVQARRYLTGSVLRPRAWLNLVTGRVDYRRLVGTLAGQVGRRLRGRASPAVDLAAGIRAELATLRERGQRVLFALADRDASVDHCAALFGRLPENAEAPIRQARLAGSDHLFTRRADQAALIALLTTWATTGDSARAEREEMSL